MTADDLRHWIDQAGVSQKGLGRLLDVNPRTVRRWCRDQSPIPDALRGRLERVTPDEIEHAMRGAR